MDKFNGVESVLKKAAGHSSSMLSSVTLLPPHFAKYYCIFGNTLDFEVAGILV
jgi:hypothetical protein